MSIHTILIVDDSPTERYYLSEMLVRAGYAVSTAENGADALAQLKQDRPDLILMDVVMPVAFRPGIRASPATASGWRRRHRAPAPAPTG